MTNSARSSGLFISYEKNLRKIVLLEQLWSGTDHPVERKILEFSLDCAQEDNTTPLEQTLGQIILYSLEKLTADGLGFGNYNNLLDQISDENFEVYCQGLDLHSPDDLYALATMTFSRGRRKGSWVMVGRALELFQQAASMGHPDAIRFISDDWPVLRPRLERKLSK